MYLDEACLGKNCGVAYDEIDALKRCIEGGTVSYNGQATWQFEFMMKQYLEAFDVIATNTGTAALHLALLANDTPLHSTVDELLRKNVPALPIGSFDRTLEPDA